MLVPAVLTLAASLRPALRPFPSPLQSEGRTRGVATDNTYGIVACCSGANVIAFKLNDDLAKARDAMQRQPPQPVGDFRHRSHATPAGPPHMVAFSR